MKQVKNDTITDVNTYRMFTAVYTCKWQMYCMKARLYFTIIRCILMYILYMYM